MEREVFDNATDYAWVEDFFERKYSSPKKLPKRKESDFSEKSSDTVENHPVLMTLGALYRLKVTALKAEAPEFEKKFKFPPLSKDHPALFIDKGVYDLSTWFWGTSKQNFAEKKLRYAREISNNSLGEVFTVIPGETNYISPITKERKFSPEQTTFFTIHSVAKYYSRIKEPFTDDLYCGTLNNDSFKIAFDIYTGRKSL